MSIFRGVGQDTMPTSITYTLNEDGKTYTAKVICEEHELLDSFSTYITEQTNPNIEIEFERDRITPKSISTSTIWKTKDIEEHYEEKFDIDEID